AQVDAEAAAAYGNYPEPANDGILRRESTQKKIHLIFACCVSNRYRLTLSVRKREEKNSCEEDRETNETFDALILVLEWSMVNLVVTDVNCHFPCMAEGTHGRCSRFVFCDPDV
ncbi:hypothetical protein M514_14300, partial [Trichuris suis]